MGLAAGAACGGGDSEEAEKARRPGPTVVRPTPQGESRTVRLGFSTLSPERTTDAYIGTFATAAQYADVVLIQRRPPWSEFLPGAAISEETKNTTLLETSLLDQYRDLRLFYAIDPTDGAVQRQRVAGLPPEVSPSDGFKDPRLREAFVAYTTYVVANYRPAYLALGVEINMLFERSREQFDAFVSLYREAYTAARQANADTKIFPTFQLEDLRGLIGEIHPPRWEVFDAFRGAIDALAISTYPYIAFENAAKIPEDYFAQLKDHFDGEILIAETGYPSEPVESYPNEGTQGDQLAYLERLLGEAEKGSFSLVVWLAALDPGFAREGGASLFKDIGLRESDGTNKLAWGTWEAWARRPLK